MYWASMICSHIALTGPLPSSSSDTKKNSFRKASTGVAPAHSGWLRSRKVATSPAWSESGWKLAVAPKPSRVSTGVT